MEDWKNLKPIGSHGWFIFLLPIKNDQCWSKQHLNNANLIVITSSKPLIPACDDINTWRIDEFDWNNATSKSEIAESTCGNTLRNFRDWWSIATANSWNIETNNDKSELDGVHVP